MGDKRLRVSYQNLEYHQAQWMASRAAENGKKVTFLEEERALIIEPMNDEEVASALSYIRKTYGKKVNFKEGNNG